MNLPRTLPLWPRALLAATLLTLSACGGSDDAPAPAPVVPEVANRGQLTGATRINTVPAADIAAAVASGSSRIPLATPLYPVTSYRLTYITSDGRGREVVASGLVSVPYKTAGARSPVISYQHATLYQDAQAPSNNAVAAEPVLVLASLGYIVVAADYVGYGASRTSPHPYLLSAPSAAAVVDLLTAAKTWRQTQNVADNGQLFMLGYSEGGYTTMAAHRAMQASGSPHLAQLVSTVPGAGPHHVGVTMDAQLLRAGDIGGLVSPGRLSSLSTTVRNELRRLILRLVIPDDADVSFQSTFLDNFLADDTAAIERDSNVHDWKPDVPVRLYHGRDDQTVPYASSSSTLQAMQARGAAAVTLTDCTAAPSSHTGCVAPYFTFALGHLAAAARDL